MEPMQFYKSLSDETRLKSLLLIQQEEELCVCELVVALGEVQPKISRHLAHLRETKLLVDRRQSKWVFYRINPDLPKWALDILSISSSNNTEFLKENTTRLTTMGNRPERAALCCK
ncbi:metalloregulator ArsR/SmtB family transcription factor [Marinomonas sp. 2405UD68-3]|uniref:metalloregulator ArsR/SmtB family transcription factor n=1 Tax=Marinomonas sp. 2405UD68-3 TaxID=3391835 RepID=UPI0039C9B0D1